MHKQTLEQLHDVCSDLDTNLDINAKTNLNEPTSQCRKRTEVCFQFIVSSDYQGIEHLVRKQVIVIKSISPQIKTNVMHFSHIIIVILDELILQLIRSNLTKPKVTVLRRLALLAVRI